MTKHKIVHRIQMAEEKCNIVHQFLGRIIKEMMEAETDDHLI